MTSPSDPTSLPLPPLPDLPSSAIEQATERAPRDNPHRRLVRFLGYEPTMEQQLELFAALAAWHATKPTVRENRSAEFLTKKGQVVKYGYADLASVIATAQTAAAFGLVALTAQEFDDDGVAIVTGYLLHSAGGALSSGPVPLYVSESDRPGQAHAGGLTTSRRLATQMVIGLAAERDDDFNSSAETSARSGGSTQGRDRGAAPSRRQPAATATERPAPPRTHQGPPPGWLSREDRQKLEQEIQDPHLTPERFQEIEELLQAAKQASTAAAAGGSRR